MKNKPRDSPIDFDAWESSRFSPTFLPDSKKHSSGSSCGPTALTLITGIDIAKFTDVKGWSDEAMLAVLDAVGIKHVKLDRESNVGLNLSTIAFGRVHGAHVLLQSRRFTNTENSWVVRYGGNAWHNFNHDHMGALDEVNLPAINTYILKHPSWDKFKKYEKPVTKAKHTLKTKLKLKKLLETYGIDRKWFKSLKLKPKAKKNGKIKTDRKYKAPPGWIDWRVNSYG